MSLQMSFFKSIRFYKPVLCCLIMGLNIWLSKLIVKGEPFMIQLKGQYGKHLNVCGVLSENHFMWLIFYISQGKITGQHFFPINFFVTPVTILWDLWYSSFRTTLQRQSMSKIKKPMDFQARVDSFPVYSFRVCA